MTREEARRMLLAQLRELLYTCWASLELQVEIEMEHRA